LAIDSRKGSVIANTSLGAYPLSLAVDSDTNMVYVGACEQISLPCIGAEMLSVNGTSHEVQSVVPLNFDALNFNVVVDQATNTVYIMGEDGSNLVLASIDGVSGAVKYLSALGASCAGAGGGTLAINTASDQVVASFDGQEFLLFIDGPSGRIVNMVNASRGVYDVAFNPSNSQAYLTMEAQREGFGYLLVLPATMNQSYVDSSLLPGGICLP
jgi:DNA-binding beta-propeller fold protein YncE